MKRPKVERLKGQASLWAERRAVLEFRVLQVWSDQRSSASDSLSLEEASQSAERRVESFRTKTEKTLVDA